MCSKLSQFSLTVCKQCSIPRGVVRRLLVRAGLGRKEVQLQHVFALLLDIGCDHMGMGIWSFIKKLVGLTSSLSTLELITCYLFIAWGPPALAKVCFRCAMIFNHHPMFWIISARVSRKTANALASQSQPPKVQMFEFVCFFGVLLPWCFLFSKPTCLAFNICDYSITLN